MASVRGPLQVPLCPYCIALPEAQTHWQCGTRPHGKRTPRCKHTEDIMQGAQPYAVYDRQGRCVGTTIVNLKKLGYGILRVPKVTYHDDEFPHQTTIDYKRVDFMTTTGMTITFFEEVV